MHLAASGAWQSVVCHAVRHGKAEFLVAIYHHSRWVLICVLVWCIQLSSVLVCSNTFAYFCSNVLCRTHSFFCPFSQVIVPKVVRKFWQSHERLLFDYVLHGGQLYVIGGQTPKKKESRNDTDDAKRSWQTMHTPLRSIFSNHANLVRLHAC